MNKEEIIELFIGFIRTSLSHIEPIYYCLPYWDDLAKFIPNE